MGAYNQIFNVGADRVYTVNEVGLKVCTAMGVEPRIVHLRQRSEVKDAYCSHEKVQGEFQVGEGHSFDAG